MIAFNQKASRYKDEKYIYTLYNTYKTYINYANVARKENT